MRRHTRRCRCDDAGIEPAGHDAGVESARSLRGNRRPGESRRPRLIVSIVAAGVIAWTLTESPSAARNQSRAEASEDRIPVGTGSLYVRAVGQGQPALVLHDEPDFDHGYLLPDMDRLGDVLRLIYYDQRGRGRSADHVQADDVSLASDIEDLDRVRMHVKEDSVVLLGHSWGTVLALEYALRHPTRVSRR
jgi:hypothetical protein